MSAELARRVVGHMMERDAFSQWLGIEVLESAAGVSRLKMTVRAEMVNGFGVAHGGIAYSLADSALAFASNSYGRVSVAIENGMAYPEPVRVGDVLTAEAQEMGLGERIATYQVAVTNQNGKRVGVFRGTVYRTKKTFFSDEAQR